MERGTAPAAGVLDYHARDSSTGGIVGPSQEDRPRRGAPPLPSRAPAGGGRIRRRGRHRRARRGPGPRPTGSDPAAGRVGQGGRPVRTGGLRAFREAYQPADFKADLRALPELLRSRAVTIPALLVVISAVILVLAVQMAPGSPGLPGASASPGASATLAASASPPPSAATSPGASASPAPSGAATDGAATVSGSPLGIIASILALLFLGIPSPPAIGGIYLAAILAKRSSYLAGGLAGLFGSLGALAAVIAISPNEVGGVDRGLRADPHDIGDLRRGHRRGPGLLPAAAATHEPDAEPPREPPEAGRPPPLRTRGVARDCPAARRRSRSGRPGVDRAVARPWPRA